MVNNEDDIEILKSKRNRDILIIGGYLYNICRQNAKKCMALPKQKFSWLVSLSTTGCRMYIPHNHNTIQDEINVLKIQNVYKK
jgi:hypothetical protein